MRMAGLRLQNRPHRTVATRHMLVMLLALACFAGALAVRGGPQVPAGWMFSATLALEAAGLALLMLGGFLGGELVYRHGDGRVPAKPGKS